MARINGERRQHRKQALREIIVERLPLSLSERFISGEGDAVRFELRQDFILKAAHLFIQHREYLCSALPQLLSGRHSIRR